MSFHYIQKYYQEIEESHIIAGQELKQMLKKLLNLSSNFFVDNQEVENRIVFIEKFIKHTKSPFNGQPFKLELWEKAFIEAVYGIKNSDTKRRKFKKVILLISRKNGKSTFCSALVITELFLGNSGTNICISSNDDAQANIIMDEIKDSISLSRPLKKRSHPNIRGVSTKRLSKIFKISDKTKNKEGRNIDFAILDESHEMKDNVIAKSIEQSQSTKDEPLFINITTEGFVNDGYLDEELSYARKVNDGEIDDDTLLAWLYTQDSEQEIWQDKSSWQKSNPNLNVSKKISYLEGEINKAKYSRKDRVFMLAKDFNIKQNTAAAWLTPEDVEEIEEYDLEKFRGKLCLASFDLAETSDLGSAKILLIRPEDKRKCIVSKYFLPSEKIINNKDGVDYSAWVREGYIEVTEGHQNDQRKILKWFQYLEQTYGIRVYRGGYDHWHAIGLEKEIDDYYGKDGNEYIFSSIPQRFETLSDPMCNLEIDLKSKNVLTNKNPMDKMCLLNTGVELNKIGLQRPVKQRAVGRIDGAVTMIMLYFLFNKFRNELYYLNGIEG